MYAVSRCLVIPSSTQLSDLPFHSVIYNPTGLPVRSSGPMPRSPELKKRPLPPIRTFTDRIDDDPSHHLAGPFRPQTPLWQDSTPSSPGAPWPNSHPVLSPWSTQSRGLWADIKSLRWVIVPTSSLKILLLFVVLWANWEILSPYFGKDLKNPFAPFLFISHRIPFTSDDDPRYRKGWLDLAFIAYYIVVWSFVRQAITIYICRPIAQWFGIRKEAKLDRFGEQGYAVLYFAFTSSWGIRIMSQLPTWWYNTKYFWIDYPHWDMKAELKAYYLVQAAYWCQQLIVMLLGLEKPRKDYYELVAHHFVTLWLVGWSYLVNLTFIGNAVYLSMDLPDSLLALSKLANYVQWNRTKVATFVVFLCVWSYFRHWLNWVMLYSVWFEFDLMPESSKRWSPEDGVWLVWWMKYQVFLPLLLLQFLNLFWYFLVWRIAIRAIRDIEISDVRSDDEDDGEPDDDDNDKDE
ncbi:TLC domain-containing protein [Dichomitus squalens]|uniref:TLC domain-containing protein n=1 Tax=Dichomitus squalens TaxID=114155 RepID=A0A4Q9N1M0_9APHY|nr:TLC domain-containing protein [Dichomitus squalens]TBU45065.1 TLC domain-containing protein [Dichomitus squalens]TBU63925.1 TLC domain-containing protein [Dichomitus squalens]